MSELKELAKYFGLPEDANIDAIKGHVTEAYVSKEVHTKALGETHGKTTHELVKAAKDAGIEIEKSELKELDTKGVAGLIADRFKSKLAESESGKSATAAEVEAKYKGEIEQWKKKYTDLDTRYTQLGSEFDGYKVEVDTKAKNAKKSDLYKTSASKLKFGAAVDELSREGFYAKVNKKYDFDLAEDGSTLFAIDRETGKRVPSKTKSATDATIDEIFEAEFKAHPNLAAVADPKKVHTFVGSVPPVEVKPVRQVAPRH